jgi:hypothetical protein
MATAEQLLNRATRLLAMALAASERGDLEAAERLTAEASVYFDQATGLDTPRPLPLASDQPVMQQQQQQQQQSQPDLPQNGTSGVEDPKDKAGSSAPDAKD